MKISVSILLIVIVLNILQSCSGNSTSNEEYGRGKVSLYIEDSYKPLFETSIHTFEGQFPKAKIEANFCTELTAIEALFANKTKTIFISRDLTKQEKAKLLTAQVEVRSEKIADEAVALIVHLDNKDTCMSVSQLLEILKGKTINWPTMKNKIDVVYDNQNSANFNYLQNLTKNSSLPANVFAVKSNEEVIKYVKEHPNAIGVIGVNWISDEDDPKVLDFLDGIRVISLSSSDKGEYYKPFQAYIYDKKYPLTRELWSINKAAKQGINSSFVNFLTGEKGQLIIQKSSLIPATAQVRMIQIKVE